MVRNNVIFYNKIFQSQNSFSKGQIFTFSHFWTFFRNLTFSWHKKTAVILNFYASYFKRYSITNNFLSFIVKKVVNISWQEKNPPILQDFSNFPKKNYGKEVKIAKCNLEHYGLNSFFHFFYFFLMKSVSDFHFWTF